jgi:acyl carrier protein
MSKKEEIVAVLRNFILENYLFSDDQSLLNNDDSFLESKIMDSMGVLELVSFLEEQFEVTTEDQEMIPGNLDSIDKLVAFVEKKTAG